MIESDVSELVVCRGSFAGVVIELVSLSTTSSTYYYILYLIFFTLHPWVASIRPLMAVSLLQRQSVLPRTTVHRGADRGSLTPSTQGERVIIRHNRQQ